MAEVTSTARRGERRVLPFDFPSHRQVQTDDAAASRLVLFAALWVLILVAAGVGGYKRIEAETRAELIGMEAQ